MIRTYSDLLQLTTFEDRFEYLRLVGKVGFPTFGHERWINQQFYTSSEWRRIRNEVIARDNGFDLGVVGHPISGNIIVQHMCPLYPEKLEPSDETFLSPEYLISCSIMTHKAIHFCDAAPDHKPIERRPGDTLLWSPLR